MTHEKPGGASQSHALKSPFSFKGHFMAARISSWKWPLICTDQTLEAIKMSRERTNRQKSCIRSRISIYPQGLWAKMHLIDEWKILGVIYLLNHFWLFQAYKMMSQGATQWQIHPSFGALEHKPQSVIKEGVITYLISVLEKLYIGFYTFKNSLLSAFSTFGTFDTFSNTIST